MATHEKYILEGEKGNSLKRESYAKIRRLLRTF